jgi:glycosyltransferase involved in cell wall biosynthesis
MHVAILGCRGIPNHYGGFEQFAEQLATWLVQQGHRVSVYNSSLHPYREKTYQGVEIIHCYDPEDRLGTAGQLVYDLGCILDARQRKFDVILQLGYTSSAIWYGLHPRAVPVLTNMDGLEWKRSKYGPWARRFLRWSEARAAQRSQALIADSLAIQSYLQETYGKPSTYIPYSAVVRDDLSSEAVHPILNSYGLTSGAYHLLIARMEPDNHIHTILEGHQAASEASTSTLPLILVGKPANRYAQELQAKYPDIIFSKQTHRRWLGGVYEQKVVEILRQNAAWYFHGHSVGGTNPSLLEAMASGCRIIAHNNPFNRAVTGEDAFYFRNSEEVCDHLLAKTNLSETQVANNRRKITDHYTPHGIAYAYQTLLETWSQPKTKR